MKYLIMLTTMLFSGELEVNGDLKVTGKVDAQGNPITNVGSPLLSTDAANAGYVLNAAAGKGRIIILKCPWITYGHYTNISSNSCEPPVCPTGWIELAISNEITAISGAGTYGTESVSIVGNSIRYCMEQEER